MIKVVNDSFINSHLLEILKNSEKWVVLISPYLKLWGHLETEIQNCVNRGVDVQLWFRTDKEKEFKKTLDKLRGWRVKVDKIDLLHSKLYLSEKEGLMTSMNLLDFSKSNSRDMGILTDDRGLRNQFKKYIEDLTQKEIVPSKGLFGFGKDLVSKLTEDSSPKPTPTVQQTSTQPTDGYCIRCSDSIPFSMKSPYCKKCYKSWNKYKNKDYGEEFCHQCSKEWDTSFKKPICLSCFKSG